MALLYALSEKQQRGSVNIQLDRHDPRSISGEKTMAHTDGQ